MAIKNIASQAGRVAGKKEFFGGAHRIAVYPVHTRFEAVSWFVADAWRPDEKGFASIVSQCESRDEAIAVVDKLTGADKLTTETVQNWVRGSMVTAQMTLAEAKERVRQNQSFVISCQAISLKED